MFLSIFDSHPRMIEGLCRSIRLANSACFLVLFKLLQFKDMMLINVLFFLFLLFVPDEVVGLDEPRGGPISAGSGSSAENGLLSAKDDEADEWNNPLEKLGNPHVQQYHDIESVKPPNTDKGMHRQSLWNHCSQLSH